MQQAQRPPFDEPSLVASWRHPALHPSSADWRNRLWISQMP